MSNEQSTKYTAGTGPHGRLHAVVSHQEVEMPKVLNKYKDGVPTNAVYIGRPSKWGNPFVIGKDGTREEVIAKYRTWLLAQPAKVEAAKRELAGKDLVCFCAPQGCHGDVLLEVANAEHHARSEAT